MKVNLLAAFAQSGLKPKYRKRVLFSFAEFYRGKPPDHGPT